SWARHRRRKRRSSARNCGKRAVGKLVCAKISPLLESPGVRISGQGSCWPVLARAAPRPRPLEPFLFEPMTLWIRHLRAPGGSLGNQTRAAFVYAGGVILAEPARCRRASTAIPMQSADFQIPGSAIDNFISLAEPELGWWSSRK